jgi:hypothetical protein
MARGQRRRRLRWPRSLPFPAPAAARAHCLRAYARAARLPGPRPRPRRSRPCALTPACPSPRSNAQAEDIPEMQPLGDRVLVRVEDAADVTLGGVVLPDSAKERPLRWGPGRGRGPGARGRGPGAGTRGPLAGGWGPGGGGGGGRPQGPVAIGGARGQLVSRCRGGPARGRLPAASMHGGALLLRAGAAQQGFPAFPAAPHQALTPATCRAPLQRHRGARGPRKV